MLEFGTTRKGAELALARGNGFLMLLGLEKGLWLIQYTQLQTVTYILITQSMFNENKQSQEQGEKSSFFLSFREPLMRVLIWNNKNVLFFIFPAEL